MLYQAQASLEMLEPRLLLSGQAPNLLAWPWDVRTYTVDANQPGPTITGLDTGSIHLSSNQSVAAAAGHVIDSYLIANHNWPAITAFLKDIGTASGDANLDGLVNVIDLVILATNYDNAGNYKWSQADYMGAGTVDVVSLGILAKYYGSTSAGMNELPVEAVAHMTPSDVGHTYQMIHFEMPSDATDHIGLIVKGSFGVEASYDSYLYAELSGGSCPVLTLWRHAGDALPTLVAGPVNLSSDSSSYYLCVDATDTRVSVTASPTAPYSDAPPTLSYSMTAADPAGADCGIYFRGSRQDAGFSILDYTEAHPQMAPVNDYSATVAGVPVTINVLGNDSLPDPVPYTITVAPGPWSNYVRVEADGSLTFTPPALASGETSHTYQFGYAIHDPNNGLDSGTSATVTVDVWTPTTLYVSPRGSDGNTGADVNHALQTLGAAMHAIEALQSVNPARAFEVLMAGGTYNITSPIVIQTSGYAGGGHTYPIVITSANPSAPATISGGADLPVTGWRRQTQGQTNVWYVDLPNTVHPFNSLFVNGARATRAREPDVGYYYINENTAWAATTRDDTINKWNSFHFGVSATGPDINSDWLPQGDNWSDLGIEVVASRQWQYTRYQIANVDDASQTVVFNEALGSPLDHWAYDMDSGYGSGCARYYVENFLQGVDTPGEWYLNKATNRLYYCPKANEMDTATGTLRVPAVAPATDQLLVVNNASNLVFQNLTFEYTDWNLASATTGTQACHVGGQAGSETIAPLADQVGPAQKAPFDRATPPAVLINRQDAQHTAGNITLVNNMITHVGGYALQVHAANNEVIGNTISDCGSGGIVLGDDDLANSHAAAIEGFTSYNSIARNTMHDLGAVMADGEPVFATLVDHTRIANNEMSNAGYSGVSIGWRWGTESTSASNNIIVSNDIHDVMRVLYDGGGIYTLGSQPGTVICANAIHDIRYTLLQPHADERSMDPDDGIYLDQGSSGIAVYGNLVYNCEQGLLLNTVSGYLKLDSNLYVDIHTMGMRFCDNPVGVEIVTHNVFTWTASASPCQAMLLIVSNRGDDAADPSFVRDNNVYHTPANMMVPEGFHFDDEAGFDEHSSAADPGLSPLRRDEAFAYVLDRSTVQALTNFTARWLLN